MKKIIIVFFFLSLIFSGSVYGNSTVIQTQETVSNDIRKIVFIITADASSGEISNTVMDSRSFNFVNGFYLYEITAYPTSGGTAPDAADVFVLDVNGEDLLGSIDGGTTAYQGLNLIHPTLKYSCIPDKFLPRAGGHQPYYPSCATKYTLVIKNQTVGSANITVILTFVK